LIKVKQKICVGWDNISHPAYIYKSIDGKKYCKNCAFRLEAIFKEKKNTELLHQTMRHFYALQPHICENCGCRTPHNFTIDLVHHLLPKRDYPDIELNTRYFQILCSECHSSFELSPNKRKHEQIYLRTLQAKKDYENTKGN
jgi:hypothetical protein